MGLRVVSFKFLGNLGETSWASAFEAGEDKLSLTRGKIWAVFSVRSGSASINRVSLSREFFSFFYNNYYREGAASNFHALKTAVAKTISRYREGFSDVELGAVSYAKNENLLNVAAAGGVWAGIVRNGFFSKILESRESVVAASGYPRENDFFAFGTKSSFLSFSSFDLHVFSTPPGGETQSFESLRKKVLSGKESQRSALFLIGFRPYEEVPLRLDLSGSREEIKGRYSGLVSSNALFDKTFFLGVVNFLSKGFSRSLAGGYKRRQRVFVKSAFRSLEERKVEKRKLALPVLMIIFIVVLSFAGGAWKRKKEKDTLLSSRFNEAAQKVEDAKKIFSADHQSSRELLWSAKEILLGLEKEKYEPKRIADLKEKIKNQEESVLKEFTVTPEIFVDLTLLAHDFRVSGVVSDGALIVVFDRESRRVIKTSFDTKKTEAVSGPSDFEDLQDVALYANKVFVLTRKGFFNVEDNSKMLFRNDFGDDALIFYYAGNVYVLDEDASRIYRINSSGENFSLPQIWTAPGIDTEMNGVKSWFIDGFIWVLYEDGRILKFSRGVPERVSLQDVFPRLEKIQAVYSNEAVDSLYVLDSVLGRVVVFGKDGAYLAQYFSEDLKGAKNVVVSEKEKKLVFLKEGDKLYVIKLRHLE